MKKIEIPVGKYTIKKSLQKPAHRDLTFRPSLEEGDQPAAGAAL